MGITEYLAAFALAFSAMAVVLLCILLVRVGRSKDDSQRMEGIRKEINSELRASREDISRHSQNTSADISRALMNSFSREDARLEMLQKSVNDRLASIDKRMDDTALASEMKLENMRQTLEKRLAAIQEDNARQLTEMRNTVDEKLQKTLEDKIGQSFQLVSERLEMVYKNLGEMKNLAQGVGDLKKVLSNVKTRGIYGELQLQNILEQILAPEQYECNVITKKDSRDPVEFAVKFPSEDGSNVYLPIDSKFPLDAYEGLLRAYDSGDKAAVQAAASMLVSRVKQEAKKIRDKYVDPPNTTEFAIMFLPVEGLYAEVVRCGLVDVLQQEYRVSIAGPTTLAALLNAFHMGFRTLAIQRRSSQVWHALGEVKKEFQNFADVLTSAQNRINKANEDLDKLIGVRTRKIQRELELVSSLPIEDPYKKIEK